MARDQLGQLGDEALHVVVGLGGERPDLGSLEHLYQVDHGVLLGVGFDGAWRLTATARVVARKLPGRSLTRPVWWPG